MATEEGLFALIAEHHDIAANLSASSLRRCAVENECLEANLGHLRDIQTIASGDIIALHALAEALVPDRPGPLLLSQLRLRKLWALAIALDSRRPGSPEARRIYAALRGHFQFRLGTGAKLHAAAQQQSTRYDELMRSAIKAQVLGGEIASLDAVESLRAQSVLRRLRTKRWQQQHAKIEIKEAQAQLRTRTAGLDAMRAMFTAPEFLAQPLGKALNTVMAPQLAELAEAAQEEYLQEFGAAVAASRGYRKSEKWLEAMVDTTDYVSLVESIDPKSYKPMASLGENRAYFSWMRVTEASLSLRLSPRSNGVSTC